MVCAASCLGCAGMEDGVSSTHESGGVGASAGRRQAARPGRRAHP